MCRKFGIAHLCGVRATHQDTSHGVTDGRCAVGILRLIRSRSVGIGGGTKNGAAVQMDETVRPCSGYPGAEGAGGRLTSVTVDPAKESARNFGNRDSGLKFAKLKRAA